MIDLSEKSIVVTGGASGIGAAVCEAAHREGAYVGVIETGRAKAGDTFVVSAAAGCTGLLVGQIN